MAFMTVSEQQRHDRVAITTSPSGVVTSNTASVATVFRRYVKQVVPRTKKPKGWKPPTAYRCYGSSIELGVKSMFVSAKTTSGWTYSYNGADSQHSVENSAVSFDASVVNKAVLNARSNLKGQKVNFALAFAEAKQTAGLIADTATRLSKAITACKRGNLRQLGAALGITRPPSQKAKKLAKAARKDLRAFTSSNPGKGVKDYRPADRSNAHNLFLEHQFGWLPLLSDIKGAAEAVAETHLDRKDGRTQLAGEPYAYYVVGGSLLGVTYPTVVSNNILIFGTFPGASTFREKKVFRAKVRLDCYLDNPALQALAQAGFTNPLSLAWEKVPWSFVADWVLPIGKYFAALDSSVGWKFRAGSISKKMTGQATRMFHSRPTLYPGYQQLFVAGHGKATMFDLDRQLYTSFPLPSVLHPRNPFSGSAASTRVAKSIALLTQQFSR